MTAMAVDFKIQSLAIKDGDGKTLTRTLDAQNNYAFTVERGRLYQICTRVLNKGSTGEAYSEAGFLEKENINTFFSPILPFSLVTDAQECSPNENYRVDNRKVQLNAGESATVCHEMFAPTTGGNLDWGLFSETFVKCGGGEGNVMSWTIDRIQLTDPTGEATEIATCSDKKQNQLETDVDCGGVNCNECSEGQKCKTADDCKDDLVCTTIETSSAIRQQCTSQEDVTNDNPVVTVCTGFEGEYCTEEEGDILVNNNKCNVDADCNAEEICRLNDEQIKVCIARPKSAPQTCVELHGENSELCDGLDESNALPAAFYIGFILIGGVVLYIMLSKKKRRRR